MATLNVLQHGAAACVLLLSVGCGGGAHGSTSDDGATPGGGPSSSAHLSARGGGLVAAADLQGTALKQGDQGVWCMYARATDSFVKVSGESDAKRVGFDLAFWNVIRGPHTRTEVFTDTVSTVDLAVSSLATTADSTLTFAATCDWGACVNATCKTDFTDISSTHVAGSIDCTNVPSRQQVSPVSFTLSFDCTSPEYLNAL